MAKRKRLVYKGGTGPMVPTEYVGMDEVRLEFADNFIIQHDPDGFYLTFFQVQHPIAINQVEAAKIKKVKLLCVGRIFLTPNTLDAIINALTENRENFKKKFVTEEIEIEEPQSVELSEQHPEAAGEA
jgi:hypothetical protein